MSATDTKQYVGKPTVSAVPYHALVHVIRVFEYGAAKYNRGNFLRSAPPATGPLVLPTPEETRWARYVDAAGRHVLQAGDAANHRADGLISKEEYFRRQVDPESGLLHAAHAVCGLLMALQQAVEAGLIPPDPGPGNPVPAQLSPGTERAVRGAL